jgi:hypothetical protein
MNKLISEQMDIDVIVDDPSMDGPSDSVPEPMTDDYDIFLENIISYSQLMSHMSINTSVGTSGT